MPPTVFESRDAIAPDVFPHGTVTLADAALSEAFEEIAQGQGGPPLVITGHSLAHYRAGKALALVYELLGIRPENMPSKQASQTIARTVYRTFPWFTQVDICEAFLRAMRGDFPANLETWGRIELPLLLAVLHRYDRWRTVGQLQKQQQVQAELPPAPRSVQVVATRVLNDAGIKVALLEQYRALLTEGTLRRVIILPNEAWALVYDLHLHELPEARLRELLDQGKARVAADHNGGLLRTDTAGKLDAQAAFHRFPARCKTEACRLALGEVLHAWQQQGLTAEALEGALNRACYVGPESFRELWQAKYEEALRARDNAALRALGVGDRQIIHPATAAQAAAN